MTGTVGPRRERGRRAYVPALGFDLLTPLYDPVLALLMREPELRERLLDQAGIGSGQEVLDIGCGTGTLAILAKRRCPGARIVGLDGDPKILEIARQKVERAGVDVELVEGRAEGAHFPAASFDRVLSSLVLHHLTREEKAAALSSAHRLLRAGGELHVADFGAPRGRIARWVMPFFRCFDGESRTRDNLEGRLPGLMSGAGFREVRGEGWLETVFGTVEFLAARRA